MILKTVIPPYPLSTVQLSSLTTFPYPSHAVQVTLKVTKSSVQLYESLGDNKLQLNNNKTEMILTARKKFLSSLFLSPSNWMVMTSNFPTQ